LVLKRSRYITFRFLRRRNLLNIESNLKGLLIVLLVLGAVLAAGIVISQGETRRLYDLSDFPEFLIEDNKILATIVVGEQAKSEDVISASALSQAIRRAKSLNLPEECFIPDTLYRPFCQQGIPKAITTDKNIFYTEDNIIAIGGPCANSVTAQILDLPTTWPECATGFQNGTGRIALYNKWNHTQIVVAGYSAGDTRNVAEILKDYSKYNLTGYDIGVSFNSITNKNEIYAPYIEPEIYEKLKTSESIEVSIVMSSDESLTKNLDLWKTHVEQLQNRTLSKLTEEDFTLKQKYGPVITGRITQSGLQKISRDSSLKEIRVLKPIQIYSEAGLNSLIVRFNNLQSGNLIAATRINRTKQNINGESNDYFRAYFENELTDITKELPQIDSISIVDWYSITDISHIKITYKANQNDQTKSDILNTIKTILENKWYVKSVNYNEILSAGI